MMYGLNALTRQLLGRNMLRSVGNDLDVEFPILVAKAQVALEGVSGL